MSRIWIYQAAVFLSAFLFFQIQPMTSRALLPLFGGSYLVWGVCMIFYQAVLLLGYLYTHAMLRRFGVVRYSRIHWILLLLPLLAVKNQFIIADAVAGNLHAAGSIVATLALAVGLPVLALSTTSIMLQKWLLNSNLPERSNPYMLYSGSNLGSMLGLLTYPVLIEPFFSLDRQWHLWLAGYICVICLHAFCIPVRKAQERESVAASVGRLAPELIMCWFMLGVAGSALLLAITNVITLDLASIPLLWIVPLAVYLFAYVLTFKAKSWYPVWWSRIMSWAVILGMLLYLMIQIRLTLPIAVSICLYMLILFVVCLTCSGELVRSRPIDSDRNLTAFYLTIATGGLAGSLLIGWVIPLISRSLVELPLALVLSVVSIAICSRARVQEGSGNWRICDLAPSWWPAGSVPRASATCNGRRRSRRPTKKNECLHQIADAPSGNISKGQDLRKFAVGVLVCGLIIVLSSTFIPSLVVREWATAGREPLLMILIAVPVVLTLLQAAGKPWQFVILLIVASVSLGFTEDIISRGNSISRVRNFYGIYKVYDAENLRYLQHGTTQHGRQYISGPKTGVPLSYYHPSGPAGELLVSTNFQFRCNRIGMIGLGTGALAAYFTRGQTFSIFELDPDNVPIAERDFTYLKIAKDRGVDVRFIIGDGRLSMRKLQKEELDLLLIDAFNSGSIPVHLMTLEALKEYFRVLGDEGLLLMHVSNRFIDLPPVVCSNAGALGLSFCEKSNAGMVDPDAETTQWVALSRNPQIIGMMVARFGWSKARVGAGNLPKPWTDRYSNVLGALTSFSSE